ncbi:MAG: sigma-54 dependent transcriptional regulator [Fibrobacterota bacterium]
MELFGSLLSRYPFLDCISLSRYDTLLVAFKESGKEVQCFPDDSFHYESLVYSLQGADIREFFRFPKEDGYRALLNRVRAMSAVLQSRDNVFSGPDAYFSSRSFSVLSAKDCCNKLIGPAGWFYNIPLAALYPFGQDGEWLFGLIRINSFQHHFLSFSSEILANTDKDGTLIAYNRPFQVLMNIASPKEILSRSLEHFVRFSRQEERLKGTTRLREAVLSAGAFVDLDKELFSIETKEGVVLCNQPSDRPQWAIIPLPFEHDFSDYKISFRVETQRGAPPRLMLRTDNDRPPDRNGYLFGEWSDGSFEWKKGGLVVRHCILPGGRLPGTVRDVVVMKEGDRFLVSVEGVEIFSYDDRFPFPREPGHSIAFYFDKGSLARISSLRMWAAPSRHATGSAIMASFIGAPRRVFQVYQTAYYFQAQACFRYHFEETTHFLNRISHLEKEKVRVLEEKERIQQELLRKDATSLFIGTSPAIRRIKETLSTIGPSANSLLLIGETGTGKEVLAHLFHAAGKQSKETPFVKLDCSTLPSTLLESELFGYEPGAFTGASDRHIGRFEQANGGMLFLDEIANLTLEAQAKLLGVLDDFKITRIGGNKSIPLNIRVVAASNQSLEKLIIEGRFRQDLFYRLNRFRIDLPPLRERIEDVSELSAHFLLSANREYGKHIKGITERGYRALHEHPWPGNVRELSNVISRAVLMSEKEFLGPSQFQFELFRTMAASTSVYRKNWKRGNMPKETLIAALKHYSGNLQECAAIMEISRPTIYAAIRRFGLSLPKFRKKKRA